MNQNGFGQTKMCISNDEAIAEGMKIAEEFLRGMEARNWSWRCVDARPDLLATLNKERKTCVNGLFRFLALALTFSNTDQSARCFLFS